MSSNWASHLRLVYDADAGGRVLTDAEERFLAAVRAFGVTKIDPEAFCRRWRERVLRADEAERHR